MRDGIPERQILIGILDAIGYLAERLTGERIAVGLPHQGSYRYFKIGEHVEPTANLAHLDERSIPLGILHKDSKEQRRSLSSPRDDQKNVLPHEDEPSGHL